MNVGLHDSDQTDFPNYALNEAAKWSKALKEQCGAARKRGKTMSYIDREKLLRCLNDNWLAHTPNDNDEKKVRKLKRVFCKGLDMAFDIVKEFPTSEPEDFVPGSIVTIKKGHARYGFISSEKGAFFIVYASEKEMPIGTIPEGTQDGELNPIMGFNVYCVEQIEALADYFRIFAEYCKEHPEFLKPV